MSARKAVWFWTCLLALIGMALLSNVPTDVTAEDRMYIEKILTETGNDKLVGAAARSMSYEEQISAIQAIQNAAFDTTPKTSETDTLFRTREPKDLYYVREASCYDRSRLIEKIATYLGFEIRHVAIYQTTAGRPAPLALVTPRVPSHALSEINTRRGWIAVESISRWLGLNRDGDVVSVGTLASLAPASRHWHPDVAEQPSPLLRGSFTYVLGLYSRHGAFYPPYLPFPDVNFRQLASNVGG